MSEHLSSSQVPPGGKGTAAERRSAPRLPAEVQTVCRPVSGTQEELWPGQVINVSRGGIALVLGRRFEAGTLIIVNVQGEEGEGPRTLLARVRHVTPQAGGLWLLGCAFVRQLGDDAVQGWTAPRARPAPSDRRAWVRLPCDLPAGVARDAAGAGPAWEAKVVDLSAGGLALASPGPQEQGTLLRVEVADAEGQALRVLVRVAQCKPRPEGGWLLGCEFAGKLGDDDLQAMTR